MEKNEQLKKRKRLLLIAPLLVLPFVTLAFWALGGGKPETNVTGQQQSGINNSLPKAKLKQSPLDKMSLYAQADEDSAALRSEAGNFNYPSTSRDSIFMDTARLGNISSMRNNSLQHNFEEDPNEFKIRSKLSELQSIIDHPAQLRPASDEQIDPATYGLQPGEGQLEKLKTMLSAGQDNGGDSDMQQINTLLEKVMDVQHPQRVEEKLRAQSAKERGRVFAVERPPDQLNASLLSSPLRQVTAVVDSGASIPIKQSVRNAFYDIADQDNADNDMHLTIPAVIAQTQILVSGESVKMRLTEDVYINGTLVPKNNFVYGTCIVSGERLKINVQSIRFGNQLFPVNLSGYDLDAIEGIRIPGAITRDASKEGADRALQGIQMMSLDPNIGAQAAAAGIEATKGLLSKKVRLIRVTVKANYPLLLLDAKGMQEER